MLIRFNVENFLSFNKNEEFSMLPGRAKTLPNHLIEQGDVKLLKYCAMYGANASGKSNFVKALDVAKQIITKGIENVNTTNKYCRYSKANIDKPTSFEFEIRLNDISYAYGFKANLYARKIHSEWLYEITPKKEIMIFERIVSDSFFDPNFSGLTKVDNTKLNVYIDDIKGMDDNLFLTELARKKIKKDSKLYFLNDICNWFDGKLKIIYPHSELGGVIYFFNADEKNTLTNWLTFFDTGITHFKLKEISIDEFEKNIPQELFEKIIEDMNSSENIFNAGILSYGDNLFEVSKLKCKNIAVQKLSFEHGEKNKDIDFEYHEESDGTRRLIDLLTIIQESTTDDGTLFVVDEIDRSLHPMLTKKFIELFFKVAEDSKSQLITTTHESVLMDLSLLRRDEVWFVERETDYNSHLFSLDAFKERYDKKVNKAYLEGRYGALPLFNSFDSCMENNDG
ncbi:MAG: ATP-binding protein [Victivallaceae bacterium]|nr:ATP-binding protein [Victivallaceae bacterium]